MYVLLSFDFGAYYAEVSCAMPLIGPGIHLRRYCPYEVTMAWNDGKGVLGIDVHNLDEQTRKGHNPLDRITCRPVRTLLSDIVRTHDPEGQTGQEVYEYIEANIGG